jgi:hypothetical protein
MDNGGNDLARLRSGQGRRTPPPIYESHYGPVIAMKDGKAYVAKIAYADWCRRVRCGELNYAKDYRASEGSETLQFYPQNCVADTRATSIIRCGRVPRRPAGFDCRAR